jgi:RNA polymerase sigma-70 factor (ECF subfamily)
MVGLGAYTSLPTEAALNTLSHDMEGYQSGDRNAFLRLYAILAPDVRRYLASLPESGIPLDTQVDQVFRQIHQVRRTYDPAHPVIPWVLAIAQAVHGRNRRRPLES